MTALLLFGLVACNGDEAEEVPEVPVVPVETKTIDAATVGSISGTVRYDGEVPEPKEISFGADAACKKQHDEPVYFSTLLAVDGLLENSFVYVRDGLEAYTFATPTTEAVIDQVGCVYEPRVSGLQTGQTLTFVNSDPTAHNVHPVPKVNRGMNLSMPTQGMRTSKTFRKAEVMVRTKCDIHPWMGAYFGVVAHPFFAVTGPDGSFSLEGLPPGDYVVEAWHEKLGTVTAEVTLGASGAETLAFSFQEQ